MTWCAITGKYSDLQKFRCVTLLGLNVMNLKKISHYGEAREKNQSSLMIIITLRTTSR